MHGPRVYDPPMVPIPPTMSKVEAKEEQPEQHVSFVKVDYIILLESFFKMKPYIFNR